MSTDSSPTFRITGLTKLCDANKAGSRRADECTLILTEGDSAKALAVAGLGVVGRDTYGVFPLRGKLLNVRDAKHDQIMKNEEIQNIKKILGLQHNKTYTSVEGLRYGRLMLMTDQVRVIYNVELCGGVLKAFGTGSRWFAYQGSSDQLPGPLFPVTAEVGQVPGRVYNSRRPSTSALWFLREPRCLHLWHRCGRGRR